MKIAVLFVQCKYKNSFISAKILFDALDECTVQYLIIDNDYTAAIEKPVESNVILINGDNDSHDFSGWQKGLEYLEASGKKFDIYILLNDSFQVYGKNFIEEGTLLHLLTRAYDEQVVVGHIDTRHSLHFVYGKNVSSWIRSNAIIIPGKIISGLKSLVPISHHDEDNFVPDTYTEKSICKISAMVNGDFMLDCQIPDAKIDNTYAVLRIRNIFNGQQKIPSFTIHTIRYDNDGINKKRLFFHYNGPGQKFNTGELRMKLARKNNPVLTVEGKIDHVVEGSVYEIELLQSSPLFHENAPLNSEIKRHIIIWLSQEWHSKFSINQETWSLYRTKVRMILNEALLTHQLRSLTKVKHWKQISLMSQINALLFHGISLFGSK